MLCIPEKTETCSFELHLQCVLGFQKQEKNPLLKREISFTNVAHALRCLLLFFDDEDDVFIIGV